MDDRVGAVAGESVAVYERRRSRSRANAEYARVLASEDLESVLYLAGRQVALHRVGRAQPACLSRRSVDGLHRGVPDREPGWVRHEVEDVLDRALDADAGLEGDHAIAFSRAAPIGWRFARRAAVSGSCVGR